MWVGFFFPTAYIYVPKNLEICLVFLEKLLSEMMLDAEDCNDWDTVSKGMLQEVSFWYKPTLPALS